MTQNLRLVRDVELLALQARAKDYLTTLNQEYFTLLGHYENIAQPLRDPHLPQDQRAKLRLQTDPLEQRLDGLADQLKKQRKFTVAIEQELARREWLIELDPRIVAIMAEQQSLGRARGEKGKGEGGG